MPNRYLGFLSPVGSEGHAVLDDVRGLEAPSEARQAAADAAADQSLLGAAEQNQLENDIAEIERASAALCKAEPALESWTIPPAGSMQKTPQPVWLLIGVLWLSTALVTLGAVVVIAALVG